MSLIFVVNFILMFSRMQLMADDEALAQRFNTDMQQAMPFFPKMEISGFEHAFHPVMVEREKQIACDYFRWGLVPPDWKKGPSDIWNHTLSAKLEYLHKRYAWRKVLLNRCLIPATAYFEYHWNDAKGNSKTKYIITNASQDIFTLAALFSVWQDAEGNLLQTFAVCTTTANEIMQFVHNKDAAKNYHRMPVMLNRHEENLWLDPSIPYMDFAFPNYQPNLVAVPVEDTLKRQPQLF